MRRQLGQKRNAIIALISRGREQHQAGNFVLKLQRVSQGQSSAPGMTNQNRMLNVKLFEGHVEHLSLNIRKFVVAANSLDEASCALNQLGLVTELDRERQPAS